MLGVTLMQDTVCCYTPYPGIVKGDVTKRGRISSGLCLEVLRGSARIYPCKSGLLES